MSHSEDDPLSAATKQRARVDKVFIDGVCRTKNDILAQAVQELMGCQTFEEVLLGCQSVKSQLNFLGAFENVNIKLDTSKGKNATPHGYDVTFEVKEKRRIVGAVNTLIGNNEGSMVLSGKMPNAFGRGEFIQAEYQYGTKHSSGFDFTLSKPFIGKHRPRITAAVFQQAADYPWNTFRETNRGALAEVTLESLPNVHHTFRWEGVWRELNPLGITVPFPVREQMGHTLKSSLKHILAIDTRDKSILPTRGYSLKLSTEVAGKKLGGDIDFVKNEVEHQMNFNLFGDVVLQLTSNAGYMTTDGNHNICDKFFLGGPLDLRGFTLRGVGPQCEGASMGGTAFWAAGCHIYTPLPLRKGRGFLGEYLRLHGFLTTGSITEGWDPDKLSEPRVSSGIGLVLSLGHMARIELNYVVPLKEENSDRSSKGLQVGIGMSFL